MTKPMLWSIAGLDPRGLAGSYLDLETFRHFGVEAAGIVTAVTAQNSAFVHAIEAVSAKQVEEQYKALEQDCPPRAIKIGMLGCLESHEKILQFIKRYSGFVVLDPVLKSSSETSLMLTHEKVYIRSLIRFFPYVDLVTPNRLEAERILARSISSYADIQAAAFAFIKLGARSVLIKGGHVADPLFSQDFWTNGQESFWLANARFPDKHYRGTGCMLSSAIAACHALGYTLQDAMVIAKMYVNRGIRLSVDLAQDYARLHQGAWPKQQIDLPYLSVEPVLTLKTAFKPCPIGGLYPVVDSSLWLEKLLPLGLKCIQLRIKNMQGAALEEEIKRSVALSKKFKALLLINDYWELAIHYGADGVHLGQSDLQTADIDAIYKAGLYLGLSTHCYYEVAAAHRFQPSYIACGPIYPTISKIMPFRPQGIAQLKRWRQTLQYPLVAIGGINLERLPKILKTAVEGVALISAITKATEPAKTCLEFLNTIREYTHGKASMKS